RGAGALRKAGAPPPRPARRPAGGLALLGSIDSFGAPSAAAAAAAVASLARHGGPMPPTTATPTLKPSDFRSRVWVTRPRPGIDRFASAWLVRRFINPKARVVFAADADAARR